MMSYFTRLQRNRKGFTLIELMVVVVILGILAGAAVMTLGGGQAQDAERSRAASDISTIVSALEFYRLDVGSYPTEAAPGSNVIVDNVLQDLVTDDGSTGWHGPYLKSVPEDPGAPGTTYIYVSADGLTYTITSAVTDAGGAAITDTNLD